MPRRRSRYCGRTPLSSHPKAETCAESALTLRMRFAPTHLFLPPLLSAAASRCPLLRSFTPPRSFALTRILRRFAGLHVASRQIPPLLSALLCPTPLSYSSLSFAVGVVG